MSGSSLPLTNNNKNNNNNNSGILEKNNIYKHIKNWQQSRFCMHTRIYRHPSLPPTHTQDRKSKRKRTEKERRWKYIYFTVKHFLGDIRTARRISISRNEQTQRDGEEDSNSLKCKRKCVRWERDTCRAFKAKNETFIQYFNAITKKKLMEILKLQMKQNRSYLTQYSNLHLTSQHLPLSTPFTSTSLPPFTP